MRLHSVLLFSHNNLSLFWTTDEESALIDDGWERVKSWAQINANTKYEKLQLKY